MSRITIVPDDQVVILDDVPIWFTYAFASDVNAVQWYETLGTVEYREIVNGESTPTRIDEITSFEPYEYLLPLRAQAQIDQCNARDGWHWDTTSGTCVRDS
jgi:hypothetical protein